MKWKLRALCAYFLNPHFLICFLLAWMITNGWAYLLMILGMVFRCFPVAGIASAYITFLWLPCTPEKILTFFIATKLMRRFYPEDERAAEILEVFRQRHVSAG